ncbi:hypothetical protein BH11PLA2_BH11PLA2_08150 [soil metagenome]
MSRILVLIFVLTVATRTEAQLQAQRITTGSTGFSQPLFGTVAPGGNASVLYVAEKGGTIRTINTASPTATPQAFFNYSSVSGNTFTTAGEGGLIGMAFHPDFATNRTFYTYTTADGGGNLRIDQFQTTTGGAVDYTSRINLLTIAHPGQTNHNGGWLGFKPGDSGNNLYIATGDGGSSNDPNNNSQNTSSLLGKILRVNVGSGVTAAGSAAGGYTIPTGNMTVNPNGNLVSPAPPTLTVAPEVFAYGLRNPFRNSFDRGSPTGVGRGNLYIGDVGQNTREEISFIASNRVNSPTLNQNAGSQNGINFGWRLREGNDFNPAYGTTNLRNDNVDPAFTYLHPSSSTPFFGNSVTGGYVYRGPAFADSTSTNGDLNGTYVFADYASNQIGTMRIDPVTGLPIPASVINRTSELTGSGAVIDGIASFAEDGFGNLYYINLNNGDIYRFVPTPEPILLFVVGGGLVLMTVRRKTTP